MSGETTLRIKTEAFFYPQISHLWNDTEWYMKYTIDEVATISMEMARQMAEMGAIENPSNYIKLMQMKSESIQYINSNLQDFQWELELAYLNNALAMKDKQKSPTIRRIHMMQAKKNLVDRGRVIAEKKMCLSTLSDLSIIIKEYLEKYPNDTKMANFF